MDPNSHKLKLWAKINFFLLINYWLQVFVSAVESWLTWWTTIRRWPRMLQDLLCVCACLHVCVGMGACIRENSVHGGPSIRDYQASLFSRIERKPKSLKSRSSQAVSACRGSWMTQRPIVLSLVAGVRDRCCDHQDHVFSTKVKQ